MKYLRSDFHGSEYAGLSSMTVAMLANNKVVSFLLNSCSAPHCLVSHRAPPERLFVTLLLNGVGVAVIVNQFTRSTLRCCAKHCEGQGVVVFNDVTNAIIYYRAEVKENQTFRPTYLKRSGHIHTYTYILKIWRKLITISGCSV